MVSSPFFLPKSTRAIQHVVPDFKQPVRYSYVYSSTQSSYCITLLSNPKIISSPSAQQSTRPTLHASLKSSSSSRLSQAAYLPVDGNIQPSGSSFNDSRRRGAEQRADALRSDSLLGAVEPHRVFCNMCQKWVQLRHDSSYCAYPWSQHRTKCVLRQ